MNIWRLTCCIQLFAYTLMLPSVVALVGGLLMLLCIGYMRRCKSSVLHRRLAMLNYIWLLLYICVIPRSDTIPWQCHMISLGLHMGDYIWTWFVNALLKYDD